MDGNYRHRSTGTVVGGRVPAAKQGSSWQAEVQGQCQGRQETPTPIIHYGRPRWQVLFFPFPPPFFPVIDWAMLFAGWHAEADKTRHTDWKAKLPPLLAASLHSQPPPKERTEEGETAAVISPTGIVLGFAFISPRRPGAAEGS